MAENKKNNRHMTPRGKALYAHLFTPDDKFATAEKPPEYKVDLLVPEDEAQAMIDVIDPIAESTVQEAIKNTTNTQSKGKLKKAEYSPPYEKVLDEEGNETGDVRFRFKQKSQVTKKDTGETINLRPFVFDAKAKPITKKLSVGNGSVLKVSYEPVGWASSGLGKYGTTLRLHAAQIIELVEYGGPDASAFGFGMEEDGFEVDEASEEAAEEGFTSEENDGEPADGADF